MGILLAAKAIEEIISVSNSFVLAPAQYSVAYFVDSKSIHCGRKAPVGLINCSVQQT